MGLKTDPSVRKVGNPNPFRSFQKISDDHSRFCISEIKGFGKEKDESYPHHTADYIVAFTPKTKIEIVCNDDQSSKIVETIQKSAHTGRKGDGKIIVTNVEEVLSIRNKDVNERAI